MNYIVAVLFLFVALISLSQDEEFLDNTFGSNGSMVLDTQSNSLTNSIAVQPNGKILIAAYEFYPPYSVRLTRLNDDGSVDLSFANNGVFEYSPDTLIQSFFPKVIYHSDDKIYLLVRAHEGENIQNSIEHSHIMRITDNGILDSSFGNNGITTIFTEGGFPACWFITSSDEIYIGGGTYVDGTTENAIYVIRENGTDIQQYGNNALAIAHEEYDQSYITDLILENDTLLCVSTSQIAQPFTRFLTACKVDLATNTLVEEFGENGLFEMNINYAPNFTFVINDIYLTPDNGFLILLTSGNSRLLKLTSDGQADFTFGELGVMDISFYPYCNSFNQFIQDSDGRLFLLGSTSSICTLESPNSYHITQLSDSGEPIFMGTDDGTIDIQQEPLVLGGVAAFENNNKLVIAGSFLNPFDYNYYLARLDFQSVVHTDEVQYVYQNTLSAYPNPTSGLVNISFALPPGFRDTQTELILVDLTGREVHREALSAFALTSGALQIDLSAQPAGVYLAQWVSGNTWLDSVKIIRE